jgi:hypothetical protein
MANFLNIFRSPELLLDEPAFVTKTLLANEPDRRCRLFAHAVRIFGKFRNIFKSLLPHHPADLFIPAPISAFRRVLTIFLTLIRKKMPILRAKTTNFDHVTNCPPDSFCAPTKLTVMQIKL